MKVILSKVENGYIVEMHKRIALQEGVETTVTVHSTLEEALAHIKKQS